MREMTLGMSGRDVARWERFLVRARHLDSTPTGFFGPKVAAATEAMQKANGLALTGRADSATLAVGLGQGLLDPALDDPPAPAQVRVRQESGWAGKGPLMVAIAAAAGSFVTSVGVEWFKNQANIDAEREKLRSSLIQQAMQVAAPDGAATWSRGQAQIEVVSRLQAYVDLGLVALPEGTLARFLGKLGSVPVLVANNTAPRPAGLPPGSPSGAPANVPPAPTIAPVSPHTQRVFVQFAGSLSRDDIIAMVRSLSADWRVQGASGERIGTAAGKREVRWGDPADEDAAKALADAVEKIGVVPGEVTAVRVPVVPRGTLELWLSR